MQTPPRLDQYIEEETRKFLDTASNLAADGQAPGPNVGTIIGSLSDLDTLARETNAVFVFVPARGCAPTAATLAAINSAKQSLETALEIKIGLFTLAAGSRDYDEMAAQMSVPGVVPIVKTGVRKFICGKLTEDRIIDGFMAAVSSGGCCPLGHPPESK